MTDQSLPLSAEEEGRAPIKRSRGNHGSPASRSEWFWAGVQKTPECWLWMRGQSLTGYGRFWDGDRKVNAHRYAYETTIGPISDGMEIDHLCRNPSCVNPSHMEVVTHRVNTLRGETVTARNVAKTHCIHGHELAGADLHITFQGWRWCRACGRVRAQARRDRDRLVAMGAFR